MEVYFIRHGQTDGNVARRHQHPNTPLNEMGILQAEEAAKALKRIKPTHIISSTQLRAIQTTKILTRDYPIIPDTNSIFEEVGRPNWLVGTRYVGFTTLRYLFQWFFSERIEGGESYQDFLKRINEAKKHLESLPSDAVVVVVSHAVFTSIFLEHLCRDGKISFWQAPYSFFRIFKIENAGITHLHYSPGTNICGWTRVK